MNGIDPHTFYWGRIILSAIAAGVCSYAMHKTDGEHGLGWFFIMLIIIWG